MTHKHDDILIRRATVADVAAIGSIVNSCAEYGLMLHRSLAQLYENLRDFHVAEDAGEVVGVCGLSIVWANLAEVYSLAVRPSHRGRGLGRRLTEACIDDARRLGIHKLMTLTYEQVFFSRLGFEIVDRQSLPLKVWSECTRCPKNHACDEIAMVRVLTEVPQVEAPAADEAAPSQYEVPVALSVRGGSQRTQPSTS